MEVILWSCDHDIWTKVNIYFTAQGTDFFFQVLESDIGLFVYCVCVFTVRLGEKILKGGIINGVSGRSNQLAGSRLSDWGHSWCHGALQLPLFTPQRSDWGLILPFIAGSQILRETCSPSCLWDHDLVPTRRLMFLESTLDGTSDIGHLTPDSCTR